MSKIKLEVGRWYLSRSGDLMFRIKAIEEGWAIGDVGHSWRIDGSFFSKSSPCGADLVEEVAVNWEKP